MLTRTSLQERLRKNLGPIVEPGTDLAFRSTLGVGGTAGAIVRPWNARQASEAVALFNRMGVPFYILGGGANTLFLDGEFRGAVLHMDRLNLLRVHDDRIVAGAGATIPHLVLRGLRAGLSGTEHLAGIPGTIGGAVAMNAGGGGGDTAQAVESLLVLETDGTIRRILRSEVNWDYRHTDLEGRIVLAATFRLANGKRETIRETISTLLAKKKSCQPLSQASAGCIFKNPNGHSAGRLIDLAGLKGLRIGNAQISHLHANFIVTRGKARATDVLALIERARDTVHQSFDIHLELEVRVADVQNALRRCA